MRRSEIIESRMRALEAELAEIEKFGDDVYEDGDVLLFGASFGTDVEYRYAALKIVGKWFITGGKNQGSHLPWDDLVELFRRGQVEKVRRVTNSKRVV